MFDCVITLLFIYKNFIECLLCILDIRNTIVNKRDEETCPVEFTFLGGENQKRYIRCII